MVSHKGTYKDPNYQKKYQKKHRKELNEYHRKYMVTHPKAREYHKKLKEQWDLNHPESQRRHYESDKLKHPLTWWKRNINHKKVARPSICSQSHTIK